MVTPTAHSKLPNCIDPLIESCPGGSTALETQCTSSQTYVAQLRLALRLRVDCSSGTFCAELLVALAARSTKSIEQRLSIVRIRLAQCLTVAWQEVNGGILIWAGDSSIELLEHEYEMPSRRLQEMSIYAGGKGMAIVMPGLMDTNPSLVQAEFAFRVDSSRISASMPSTLLRSILERNHANRLVSDCLGLGVHVTSLPWSTARNAADLTSSQMQFQGRYRFKGYDWNEFPPAPTVDPQGTSGSVGWEKTTSEPEWIVQGPTDSPSNAGTATHQESGLTVANADSNEEEESTLGRDIGIVAAVIFMVPILMYICWRLGFRQPVVESSTNKVTPLTSQEREQQRQATRKAWENVEGTAPGPSSVPPGEMGPDVEGGIRAKPAKPKKEKEPGLFASAQKAWKEKQEKAEAAKEAERQASQERRSKAAAAAEEQRRAEAAKKNDKSRSEAERLAKEEAEAAARAKRKAEAERQQQQGQQSWQKEYQQHQTPPQIAQPRKRFDVGDQEPFRVRKAAIAEELERTQNEPIDERRRRFKDLMLVHHPDKNSNSEESVSVFQYLQAQKDIYLYVKPT